MTTFQRIRLNRGPVSQWTISKFTNVSQSRISNYEQGNIELSDKERGLLAKYFNMTVGELFPEAEEGGANTA